MQPIILQGRPAYSNFRQQALLHDLNKAEEALEIGATDAIEVFFIETVAHRRFHHRACSSAGRRAPLRPRSRLFCHPRKGTTSPLGPPRPPTSFTNCGLEPILRVERGIHYRIHTTNGLVPELHSLSPAGLSVLHDRMTEAVYSDVDDLFQHPRKATAHRSPHGRWPRSPAQSQYQLGPSHVLRRNRLPRCRLPADAARSHRRRTRHVLTGQLGTLPPQDLQRRVDHRQSNRRATPSSK